MKSGAQPKSMAGRASFDGADLVLSRVDEIEILSQMNESTWSLVSDQWSKTMKKRNLHNQDMNR